MKKELQIENGGLRTKAMLRKILNFHFSTLKFCGLTLVELLIYMGLLMILVGILATVFGSIIDVQLESKATSSVDQDGRYIISRLIYDFQSASSSTSAILSPLAGQQSSTLQMKINSINYTYSSSSGNLTLTNSNGTDNLNSSETSISNVSFQRIGTGTTNDTIKVNFTLTSKTQRVSGPETQSYQTTLAIQ
jgi:type II secretory pathway pseudopilin PulG